MVILPCPTDGINYVDQDRTLVFRGTIPGRSLKA